MQEQVRLQGVGQRTGDNMFLSGKRVLNNKRMPNIKIITFFLTFIAAITQVALASALIINPVDDGSIYQNGGVDNDAYLMASGPIRGVVEFPTDQISGPFTGAFLSVNPYSLPLWGKTVYVYGYESSDGKLTSSDYNAGTFLGTLNLPENLGYGQDAFFDITAFIPGVSTPFVGFNLRTDLMGTDVFSSLEYNYGHAAQLLVSPIPEPQTIALLLAGLPLLCFKRKHSADK